MLPIHTILHPTDFSERSEYALRLACALARDYGSRLIVLHVATTPTVVYGEGIVPPVPEDYLDEAQEQLIRLVIPDADVHAERRFEEGEPATEILRVAQEIHADLIILGTHGRTGLSRLLLGSVAEQVVRRAACPVVSVKTPFPEAELAASAAERTPLRETVKL
jgi:universal stress protein A